MKMRELIEGNANLLTRKYTRKEAEDLFWNDFARGGADTKHSYPADKWGMPKNNDLLKWFRLFKDENGRQNRDYDNRSNGGLPYFN